MSIEAYSAVWRNSPAKGNERLVMLALADHVNRKERDKCWPGEQRIADMVSISERQVRRIIKKLAQAGELTVHLNAGRVKTSTGPKKTNLYRLHPGGKPIPPPKATSSVRSAPSPDPGHHSTNPGHFEQEPRTSEARTPDIAVSAKPEENQKYKPVDNRKRKPTGLPGHLCDYERAEIPDISDYVDILACPDPILAAIAVTGERDKPGWGHWVKVLNRAREAHGPEEAERLFKECLCKLFGAMKAGEICNPGANLNMGLAHFFQRGRPPEEVTPRRLVGRNMADLTES